MKSCKSRLLFRLCLQSTDISHEQTLQHPPHKGRYFHNLVWNSCPLPVFALHVPCCPREAAGTCSSCAPKGRGEAKCPLGLRVKKELTCRQLCPYPVHCIQCLPWAALATPWDPSSTSLASRCPHQLALTEQRRNARLAANTHRWLLPPTGSPADTAWQPRPVEHRKQGSLEMNPSVLLCLFSWHGLQKWH